MLLTIFLACLPLLAIYLYRSLCYQRFQRFAAFPQPKPVSLLWGHLKIINEFIARGEPERHIDILFSEIREHLGNPSVFLLDLRPVDNVLCVVCNHEVAEQVSKSTKSFPYSMAKSPTLDRFEPLLGPNSIVSQQGEDWKGLRKRFNPGFAPKHLMSLLPCILDKISPFLAKLDEHALSGKEFTLDDMCVNLTFDIIGAVTMDEDLCAQLDKTQQSEIVQVYRKMVNSYSESTWIWNPRVELKRRRLSRHVNTLIKDRIQRKFTELKNSDTGANTKSRSVLSLGLHDTAHLDSHTLDQTCDQLKSFLFAGHDTTSILLQWAFYELSRTPRALRSLRQELDDLFGPDPDPAVVRAALLSPRAEDLIHRMSYVSAVIKEILRLYPPSGTARYQPPGSGFSVNLPEEGGRVLCLDGAVLYNCETVIQRDEAIYGPTKDVFMPERWLGNTDTSMQTNESEVSGAAAQGQGKGSKVPASAWRPFERGPRNCIGQELANLEARVVLACTARRYDFVKRGRGQVACDGAGEPLVDEMGRYKVVSSLFNKMLVTAKPVDGTLMQVRFASGVIHPRS